MMNMHEPQRSVSHWAGLQADLFQTVTRKLDNEGRWVLLGFKIPASEHLPLSRAVPFCNIVETAACRLALMNTCRTWFAGLQAMPELEPKLAFTAPATDLPGRLQERSMSHGVDDLFACQIVAEQAGFEEELLESAAEMCRRYPHTPRARVEVGHGRQVNFCCPKSTFHTMILPDASKKH
jgi:hypothetical protein